MIENPDQITQTILSAIRTAGVRAIVSKGWSKLGSHLPEENRENVLFIDDCPHGK